MKEEIEAEALNHGEKPSTIVRTALREYLRGIHKPCTNEEVPA